MLKIRYRNIFLIGFSGSGKSTIGPLLANKLKARFYDTDNLIEAKARKTISNIFELSGETVFRQLESNVIMNLTKDRKQNRVIALGGGAFQISRIRARVRESGLSVYLSCSLRELYRRLKEKDDRPLLHGHKGKNPLSRQVILNRMSRLLLKRRSNYTKADIRISTTNRTVAEVVRMLSKKIAKLYGQH